MKLCVARIRVASVRCIFVETRHWNTPNPDEPNVNIYFLESWTLLPLKRVVLSVYLVGGRELFPFVSREESDLRETVRER